MADVNESVAALNESAKNATEKIPATPEGMAVAYGSLLIMALLPIFFGSYRSVRYQAEQKVSTQDQDAIWCTSNGVVLLSSRLLCQSKLTKLFF